MKAIDLTHTISETSPLFPMSPNVRLNRRYTFEKNGFRETELTLCSHVGTHMDAPAHIIEDGKTLDMLPASSFVGKGLVIDCTGVGEIDEGTLLSAGEGALKEAELVLLYTGWDSLWGEDGYFEGYPLLTPKAAAMLAGKKAVGFDAPSADPVESLQLPIHRILLEAGTLLIENLKDMSGLMGKPFTLCALPIKYLDADGGPVRAVALVDTEE